MFSLEPLRTKEGSRGAVTDCNSATALFGNVVTDSTSASALHGNETLREGQHFGGPTFSNGDVQRAQAGKDGNLALIDSRHRDY